jgi:hypothetical protein
MNVLTQINNLIENLQSLKPLLSDNKTANQDHFNEILNQSLNSDKIDTNEGVNLTSDNKNDISSGNEANIELVMKNGTSQPENPTNNKQTVDNESNNGIPSWVNPNYSYDINNPRKPYMGEFEKALSATNAAEIYCKDNLNSQDLSSLASELLYGVLGSHTVDTRDWRKIMNSSDIVAAARQETNKLLNPQIDIASEFDDENKLVNQYAVLNNSSGKTLKALYGNTDTVKYILDNYGVQGDAVPEKIEDKILLDSFDDNILNMLKNLPEKSEISSVTSSTTALEVLALNTHVANLSSTTSEVIQLEELEEL